MPASPLDNPEVYRSVLERLHAGVYIVDRERRIVFWNRGAEHISGFLSQEVVGRCCRDEILVHCDSNNVVLCQNACPLLETMRDGRTTEAEVFLRHKLGFRVPVHLRAIPIKDADGNVIGAAENFEEPRVTAGSERRGTTAIVRADEITGLPNHGASKSAVEGAFENFKERQVAFSLLRVHVDGLSHFSVNHGPDAGSQLLRVVGQTLRNALRPGDFLGCWAEREFVGIVPIHRRRALFAVVKRLLALGSCAAITWWGDRLSLTLSFGLATVQAGDTVETLIARADRALDRSVDEGGNRFTFCVPEAELSAEAESCS